MFMIKIPLGGYSDNSIEGFAGACKSGLYLTGEIVLYYGKNVRKNRNERGVRVEYSHKLRYLQKLCV